MLKRVLLFSGCIFAAIGAAGFLFWQQLTQLPSWYTDASASTNSFDPANKTRIQKSRDEVLRKVSRDIKQGKNAEVQLKADEINSLVISSVADVTDETKLEKVVKGVNTEIKDGKVSTGAVVDLRELPQDELQSEEKAAIAKLVKTVPALKDRPVYVGIEGKPTIRNGQVILDDNTQVKVGNVSLSLKDVAERLNIPEEKLRSEISTQLGELPVKIKSVEVVGDSLVVKGGGKRS